MGIFDFFRRASGAPADAAAGAPLHDPHAEARRQAEEARAAREAHAARAREEIARIQRGESPTGPFGGVPTREAQEFQRRFDAEAAEQRDWDDLRQVRRGGLQHASDASLGPRARHERLHRERDEQDAERRRVADEHRRLDAERRRLDDDRRRQDLRDAQRREDQRRRDEEERRRADEQRREAEWRAREERDRRDREQRNRRW